MEFKTPLNITISASHDSPLGVGKTELQMLIKEFLESRGHTVQLGVAFTTAPVQELRLLKKHVSGALARKQNPWKVRILVLD